MADKLPLENDNNDQNDNFLDINNPGNDSFQSNINRNSGNEAPVFNHTHNNPQQFGVYIPQYHNNQNNEQARQFIQMQNDELVRQTQRERRNKIIFIMVIVWIIFIIVYTILNITLFY